VVQEDGLQEGIGSFIGMPHAGLFGIIARKKRTKNTHLHIDFVN
jgi:hypothetical protein